MQEVFAERNEPKHRKHAFAFVGLLRCAHDGCTVTAELRKGKYVYYRCSHGRGRCSLPYRREQEVSDRMGELLKGIYVKETIAQTIVDFLQSDSARHIIRKAQNNRLTSVLDNNCSGLLSAVC